jgi:Flp pilus assembly CpaF family ATPase
MPFLRRSGSKEEPSAAPLPRRLGGDQAWSPTPAAPQSLLATLAGDDPRPAYQAPRRGQSAMASAVAARGDSSGKIFDPSTGRCAGPAENFLYDLVAPAWAEVNQLVPIDMQMVLWMTGRIRDSAVSSGNAAAYDLLARRDSADPRRRQRLGKIISDMISGAPNSGNPPVLDISVPGGFRRDSVTLRPTNELVSRLFAYGYGWGPIQPYMDNPRVTEIMANSWDEIFIEQKGRSSSGLVSTGVRFESPRHFEDFLDKMVSDVGGRKRLDEEHPMVDFSLPSGERGNATRYIGRTPSLVIRRPRRDIDFTLDVLALDLHAMSCGQRDFIRAINRAGSNMLTFGETGSGKTTVLSAILDDKPKEKRILVIEDTPEITVNPHRHPNFFPMTALDPDVFNMRALVKNALRMRPDNLVIGETRDATAFDLLQALMTGTQGSMSTIHASSSEDALERLVGLVLSAGVVKEERAVRRTITGAVHFLIKCQRLSNGTRVISRIDEVLPLAADGSFAIQNVYAIDIDAADGRLTYRFVPNPDYRVGTRLLSLFDEAQLDPDDWSGTALAALEAGYLAAPEDASDAMAAAEPSADPDAADPSPDLSGGHETDAVSPLDNRLAPVRDIDIDTGMGSGGAA